MFYDYICTTCHNIKEIQHSIHDAPKVICEKCDNEMKKKIHIKNIHLKSDGFTKKII